MNGDWRAFSWTTLRPVGKKMNLHSEKIQMAQLVPLWRSTCNCLSPLGNVTFCSVSFYQSQTAERMFTFWALTGGGFEVPSCLKGSHPWKCLSGQPGMFSVFQWTICIYFKLLTNMLTVDWHSQVSHLLWHQHYLSRPGDTLLWCSSCMYKSLKTLDCTSNLKPVFDVFVSCFESCKKVIPLSFSLQKLVLLRDSRQRMR